jgi:5,5'-dehydrodivanillate O-demethylase oxygenase subunit
MDASHNELMTRVGPGTRMGALLRRFWMPVAGASEFERMRIKPVRLMGENLVLYRDLGGRWGLVDRQCAHRRADLSYGFVDTCGLRCSYHGWAYDGSGQCVSMPYEDVSAPEQNLKQRVAIKAYPVR